MYSYIVGTSRNGHKVYTGIINSAAGRYFGRQPYLVSITKGVIGALDLTGNELSVTQDTGRIIGNTNIVTTDANDTIFYARQLKQTCTSRFVKHRSMEPSRELTVMFRADSDGNYELVNVWIGPPSPPFPDASNATKDSKPFWQDHALTADSEVVQTHTITNVCPY